MFDSLVITLREGVEAALIVGIVLGYLKKAGREEWTRFVWWGVGAAVVARAAAAYFPSNRATRAGTYGRWRVRGGWGFWAARRGWRGRAAHGRLLLLRDLLPGHPPRRRGRRPRGTGVGPGDPAPGDG